MITAAPAQDAQDGGAVAPSGQSIARKNGAPIRVLFVSPETPPWVKSGGLADVTAALPAALRGLGIDARVLAPAYGPVLAARLAQSRAIATLTDLGGALPPCRLLDAGEVNGAPLLLVDCPEYYDRPGTAYQDEEFRDWRDNHLRFALLSRVAALVGSGDARVDWHADVVHGNDWPVGLAPAYLQIAREERAVTVMAVHNLAHQGIFDAGTMDALGLPHAMFSMHGLEYFGKLSFLKAGLFYAQRLVTVSPTYAREVQTDAGGQGFGGLLRGRRRELTGILNGIDVETWNPATDPHLVCRYDVDSIDLKAEDKYALQQRMGLPVSRDAMLLGVVSRLAHQKGMDWLIAIVPALARMPVQIALLGAGDRDLEQQWHDLAQKYPRTVAVRIGFDDPLAHQIEAGADAFVMPSRFEPCGLNQMYSLRYGTPPIVRATGGLADTVVDCNEITLAALTANGFSFVEADAAALLASVRRAFAAWRRPALWRALQRRGMATDFSWARSARKYAQVYAVALAQRG